MASLRAVPVLGVWALLVFGGALVASAQETSTDRSIDVQLFQTPVGPRGFITVDSANVPRHKQFSLGLQSNYQRSPFSIYSVTAAGNVDERTVDVVRDQVSMELVGAIGLIDRVELGIAIPLTAYMSGTDFTATGQPAGTSLSAAGIGDVRLEAKYHFGAFGPNEEFLLAVSPGLVLPSGKDSDFLGDKNVSGRIRGLAEFRPIDEFRAGAMLGFLVRQTSQLFKAEVGSQLLYGVAGEYRVHKQVALVGELFGRSGLKDFTERYVDANPVELDAGMRVALPSQLSLTFGAGGGVIKGIGSPRFRGFLALGWSPDFRDQDGDGVYDVEDRCPGDPEDLDGHKDSDGCPEPDNDGDGMLDAVDRCPNDPEDFDQFQDEDGCPEADNDNDGVPDLNDPCPNAAEDGKGKRPKDGCPSSVEDSDGDGVSDINDKCPDDPEDRDGFEDEDGCPEIDNDNDSIPDQFDSCPAEAEDPDGFEDSDGCPEPDNDKDGVSDAQDKCPLEPETLNGNKDEDGCPDPGAELVRLVDDVIQVRERITFSGPPAKPQLTTGGAAVVAMVAQLLRGHPELATVRVDVYADGATKEQTQARAEAVVAALTSRGVDAKRLKGAGMGPGGNRVDFVVEAKSEARKTRGAAPAPAPAP